MMRLALFLSAALLAVTAAPQRADANCVDPGSMDPLDSTILPASNLSAAGPHPGLGTTVVASGSNLEIMETDKLAAHTTVSLSGKVQNTPNPVRLDDGSYAVFVARDDGVVSRVNPIAAGGDAVEWSVSLRRASCGSDSLSATPSVHLRRFATPSFKAAYATDVVYVATRYSSTCGGDTTDNRVYALRATDGATLWSFNSGGTVDMDIVPEAGFLDTDNDMLYVASERSLPGQDSLWAIDVLTGSSSWSTDVGRVQTTPVVRGDRVYVAGVYGDVKALDKDDGALLWTTNVSGPITNNIFVEFRAPYQSLIGVVTSFGTVAMLRDDGPSGSRVWTETLPSTIATSRPVIDPESGKIYVGAKDGKIYQLNVVDGAVETSRIVDATPGAIVGDASFVFESSKDDGKFDVVRMLAGSNNGAFAKFCTPWAAVAMPVPPGDGLFAAPPNAGVCTSDADCGTAAPSSCSVWDCVQGVCVADPLPDEITSCDDGNAFTTGDSCRSGTCVGQSECQIKLDTCECVEADGSLYTRALLTSNKQVNHETSQLRVTNACLTIGSRARSAVYVHLLDDKRRPVVGADVKLLIKGSTNTALPTWQDAGGTPVPGTSIPASPTGRPGTYFAYLVAPQSGLQPNDPVQIRATVTMGTCMPGVDLDTIDFELVSEANGGLGGCDLLSDVDDTGYLRVTVLAGDTGKPLPGAAVMVGYAADPTSFYSKFDGFVVPDDAVGDRPNVAKTNASGQVHFQDFGDKLNGPYIVTAGHSGGPVEYAHVTIDDLASSDVTIVLPVASDPNATQFRYEGDVVNVGQAGSGEVVMGLVQQTKDLGTFSALDPDDLFDGYVCAAGKQAADNAFVDGSKAWGKVLASNASEILQVTTSLLSSDLFGADPGPALVGWMRKPAYDRIGFRKDAVSQDDLSFDIKVGLIGPKGKVLIPVDGAPEDADILGLVLTDYSASATTGRGAGDVFMQAHGYAEPDSNSVSVSYFDLDDSSGGDAPTNDKSWNMLAAEALYLMEPPCDEPGADPRCTLYQEAPTMLTGRTSTLTRAIANSDGTCSEPIGSPTPPAASPFLGLLDMVYSSDGAGVYDVCAGGKRDKRGTCCVSALGESSEDCGTAPKGLVGDFIKHTVSVVETAYYASACSPTPLAHTSSSPRWVFYTPGEGSRLVVPDLPADFTFACGGEFTGVCDKYQRMGLPPRVGTGVKCSSNGDCQLGEICKDAIVPGEAVCVEPGSGGELIVREYEWEAELFDVGLVGHKCQNETPCDATEEPAKDGAFSGTFDFAETLHCVTAESSNELVVN